jgi:hypothetical protein
MESEKFNDIFILLNQDKYGVNNCEGILWNKSFMKIVPKI